MFLHLGRLPADSITDPQVRHEISKRFDSVPTVANSIGATAGG